MKITILTLGTRGDVQPYVALGEELIQRNHQVTLCTGSSFKDFVESKGINFYPASIDFMEIVKTEIGKSIMNGGGNLFKILKYSKEVIFPLYRKTFDDFLAATKNSDLIIYHPKAISATDIAQYYNVPCLALPPVPILFPITEFPNLAVSPTKNLGSFFNRLSYSVIKYGESSSLKDINDFRKNVLHLPKRKLGSLASSINGKPIPILYPISPSLFTDVSSWNGHVSLTGFFYMKVNEGSLPEHLQDFINQGKPPIAISFSSMPMKNPEMFKKLLIDALERTDNRAVLLSGVSGLSSLDPESTHSRILTVESASHRLLFPQCKGIIHHGGVGTLAEALLCGKPQSIMPFNVDQPFWANRLYKLGLTMPPLHEKTLTIDQLIATLEAFDSEAYIDIAQRTSQQLLKENGVKTAADFIEREFFNAK